MRRILTPFNFIFSILILGTFYASARIMGHGYWGSVLLAIPFILVWVLPIFYWSGLLRRDRKVDITVHVLSYLSMAWLSFFLFFLLVLKIVISMRPSLEAYQSEFLYGATVIAMGIGLYRARFGSGLRHVTIPIPDLPDSLQGMTIAQITDLHVGLTIGRKYVDRVVKATKEARPQLVVFTGDMVDGPPEKLLKEMESLRELSLSGTCYLSLGNHDYYSGHEAWTKAFRELGIKVLINEHVLIGDLLLAGVTDPAARAFDPINVPDAELAMRNGPGGPSKFKILLAHNPRLAAMAHKAGFDLMLSGHTHAGQFIPWTWVVRMVHRPHYWGLSREGTMQVYVGAGTGTWGPPVRLGTRPELTILRLERAIKASG